MVSRWGARAVALLLVCLAARLACAAGEVTARADRTTVRENESFNVVFTYSEEMRGEPGFDVLQEDFDILGQNRRSNLQSLNGTFIYELSWTLQLMPKRSGEIMLPAVDFDGVKSQPIKITVLPSDTGDQQPLGDLTMETELTPESGYVQAQFVYTQRVYHRGWLGSGELSPPDFGDSDAVVRELDQLKHYRLFRDGVRYEVFEKSYLVYPQSSGELRAAPAVFTGQLREPGRSPRLKRVSAPAVSVTVKPVPAAVGNVPFLPASDLQIEEIWPEQQPEFEQGRPATRQIRITAQGLTAAQLPTLSLEELPDVRVYADQPQRDDLFADRGVTGVLEQSVALVPQRAGTLTLPAIEVSWWDTDDDVARVARIPERVIDVRPAAAAQSVSGQPATVPGLTETSQITTGVADVWRTLALVLVALWLATLAAWFASSRRSGGSASARSAPATGQERSTRVSAARDQVRRACRENDSEAAVAGLMAWGQAVWPDAPPHGLHALAQRTDGELAEQIRALAVARYGQHGSWAEPDRLRRALEAWKPSSAQTQRSADDAALAPL